MEELKEFTNALLENKLFDSILTILVSILIYSIFKNMIKKIEKNDKLNGNVSRRGRTYLRLSTSILRYLFIIFTALIILQINGIDVTSLLAGVGIAGAILGLALQDALKDIIRGFSIISDNYFEVGDIVKYNDIEGKVLVIGIKSTKIQDILTGNIISIANRNIEEAAVISGLVYVTIPMPYELPVNEAEKIISNITSTIKDHNNVKSVKYLGVTELADSSINYLLEIKCKPENKFQVKRDALRTVLVEMNKNKIDVPYNQIDVHNK